MRRALADDPVTQPGALPVHRYFEAAMPKERHRANKKNHKHSPSKVFAHGVIKITILTTKDGPKLKRAPGLKQIFIIRTSWNRDIKPTELVHAAAAELGNYRAI